MGKKSRKQRAANSRDQAAVAPAPQSPGWRERAPLLVVAALAVVVFAIYAQVATHRFIDFDDPLYVSENPQVLHGLTGSGIVWAFTHVHAGNWHPLTWISHMLDVELFGPNAGALLLMNVALHVVNCALLFLFLWFATGALGRSAVVAALFAVHPLHVESVAWVAERKDTLSALFFLLCLLAYTAYVLKKSRRAYAASVAALALGLLAKPMLVTAPFVLLLLDEWPFHRIDRTNWKQRVVEKVPFALCIVPSIFATLFAQREAMSTMTTIPMLERLANASISYVRYLLKSIWPTDLSVIYPFPKVIDWRIAVVCALLILAATAGAFLMRRRMPWLFTGWLWFVGMLLPVIGIVQVGVQSMADRYTYLPHIGLFFAIVWTVHELAQRAPQTREALAVAAGVVIALFAFVAHAQVGYWSGSVPLFEHALSVTSGNNLAHVNLAAGLLESGEYADAEREYRLILSKGYATPDKAYTGLALALSGQGELNAAADAARKAVQANPDNPDAAAIAGSVALAQGDTAAAQRALSRSMQLKSDPVVAARLSVARGDLQGARAQYAEALALHPDDADLHNSLGAIFGRLGANDQAIDEYDQALRLNPNQYDARMNYGALLSRMGRDSDAAAQFAEAGRIRPRSAEPHVYLGLLYANQHRFDAAAAEIQNAIAIDHDGSNRLLIDAIRIPPRPTAIDEYLVFLRQQKS